MRDFSRGSRDSDRRAEALGRAGLPVLLLVLSWGPLDVDSPLLPVSNVKNSKGSLFF